MATLKLLQHCEWQLRTATANCNCNCKLQTAALELWPIIAMCCDVCGMNDVAWASSAATGHTLTHWARSTFCINYTSFDLGKSRLQWQCHSPAAAANLLAMATIKSSVYLFMGRAERNSISLCCCCCFFFKWVSGMLHVACWWSTLRVPFVRLFAAISVWVEAAAAAAAAGEWKLRVVLPAFW